MEIQKAPIISDKKMAEVQGDKDACLAIIEGFGSCGGCSANCPAIATAQRDFQHLYDLKQFVELIDTEIQKVEDMQFGDSKCKSMVLSGINVIKQALLKEMEGK